MPDGPGLYLLAAQGGLHGARVADEQPGETAVVEADDTLVACALLVGGQKGALAGGAQVNGIKDVFLDEPQGGLPGLAALARQIAGPDMRGGISGAWVRDKMVYLGTRESRAIAISCNAPCPHGDETTSGDGSPDTRAPLWIATRRNKVGKGTSVAVARTPAAAARSSPWAMETTGRSNLCRTASYCPPSRSSNRRMCTQSLRR
jgi:hypothetical protein